MIEQGRAHYAYLAIEKVKTSSIDTKKYTSYIRKLPMMIKNNGFGATIAFYYSKSNGNRVEDKAYKEIYNRIEKWLIKQELIEQNLIQSVTELDSDAYKEITLETMALLSWLKRLAEGTFGKGEDDAE